MRRFSLAAAFVLAIGVAVTLAQPQVTVVLANGQTYDGSLVYRNNTVGVMTTNGLRSFPANQVALIEFTPGQPDPNELSQVNTNTGLTGFLRGSQNVLVLQDGSVITGNGFSMSSDGNQVSINTSTGRNNYMAGDIARLYLNPSAAQRLMASNQMNNPGNSNAVGTSGQFMGGQTITVPANQHWTATGIQVNEGDQLSFRATGRIQFAPNEAAGPGGSRTISGNYPVATAGGGALIGRVGNSQPFPIPYNGGTVTMPASGTLYLGINDDNLSDNSGNFRVQIARVGGQ